MNNNPYNSVFSPFRSFTREEWKRLGVPQDFSTVNIELSALKALNEPLNYEEVIEIYLPLVKLLEIHIAHYQRLHNDRDIFFQNESRRMPYIIGIAGSVAVGKSTTARVLHKLLSLTSSKPNVALVTTDGFLYPNAVLKEKGILNRKGFPESYDTKRLLGFLSDAKSGCAMLKHPIYSHLYYDILSDKVREITRPEILLVEGINVLQVSRRSSNKRRRVFVSDFFDFSIYVDAREKEIRQWYIDRFVSLQKVAFSNPNSYFHRYAKMSLEELETEAIRIWEETNLPNLTENILPTRFRADLILEKGNEHTVRGLRMRKV